MRRHWIGGEWVAGSDAGIPVLDPATEEVLDSVARGTEADVDRAVAAARAAFPEWRFLPGVEKAALLHEVARRMREAHRELARTMTREGGKPFCENLDEIEWSAACFDYYAEVGRDSRGSSLPPVGPPPGQLHDQGALRRRRRDRALELPAAAHGVEARAGAGGRQHGGAQALREDAARHAALVDVFAALPPGVVNIVTGYGAEVGEALVVHPGTDLVAFTGSLATGRGSASLRRARSRRPTSSSAATTRSSSSTTPTSRWLRRARSGPRS